ncbi:DUF4913 domain-containing protein [Paenarthrobacter sp. CAP02]|uniref:DUF4913 domain-containing protein n=1 Tax=Paenarthrobacter sp. CAP02 TaxID=3158144 RepID=UPI0032DB6648
MSNTAEQNGQFPEDHLPGTGLLFDDTGTDTEQDEADLPTAPDETGDDETPAEHSALSADGAALAGLDGEAVENLLTKVALRRYTKRLEEKVDARLDQLDWSAVAEGIETRVTGHVAEAAGIDTSTGEITDPPESTTPGTGAEDHGFELSAAEAASLVTERAGKLSAVSFKAMVARGDAPKPSSWAGRTPRWSLDDLEPWIQGLPSPDADEPEPEPGEETPEPEPAFRTVYDFYEGVYGPLYEHFDSNPGVLQQRGTAPIRWCRQWWNHESVMMRLTALWQAYEVAYAEGGGAVSTWMLDHADRHFDRIMAEGGPLSECRSDHGHKMTRYPVDPLPEGLNLDATTVQPAPSGNERSTV